MSVTSSQSQVASIANPLPVDIIVPIYRNLPVTRACLESVLASDLPVDTRIILIDDASPEPELSAWCREQARQAGIELLVNEQNRGFVASVNRGMAFSADRDVILLNSDTQVANNWVQRMQATAYAVERIATVTPFSNNASICSYPDFAGSSSLPAGVSLEEMDALAAEANAGKWAEIPTAVGFCMYIRRTCLDLVGAFDEQTFGRGYGEENEFCLRASAAGWSHRLAADVFVFHEGSVSFGNDRHGLMKQARERLAELYPDYESRVQRFIQRDPIAPLRDAISLALISRALSSFVQTSLPRLLFVTHAWGGGVEQHIQDLLRLLSGKACVLILRGQSKGRVKIELAGLSREFPQWTVSGFEENLDRWCEGLKSLGFTRIHLHHVHGWPPRLLQLITRLDLPLDITLHDYYLVSPHFHLSPLPDTAEIHDAHADEADAWPRDAQAWCELFAPLVKRAERIIAPSQDVAERVGAVYPEIKPLVQPHPETPMIFPSVTKIALLGGLSAPKGLDLVLRVVARAREKNLPFCFRLLGHCAHPLPEGITATGSYKAEELGLLIRSERPDLIWLPSQVHETFGYTLSVALASGIPVVTSEVGAFPERIKDFSQAFCLPVTSTEDEWLSAFAHWVSKDHNVRSYEPRSGEDYAQFYCSALKSAASSDSEAASLAQLLVTSPKAIPDPAVPLKSLFQVGVWGGHTESLKELERCLSVLPDDEVALASWREFAQLADALDKTGDELRQYREALARTDKQKADAEDGLSQYREAFEASQHRVAALEDHLRQEQSRREQVEHQALILAQERDQARQQVLDLVNSTSWKITRPLRLIARLLRSSPQLTRRAVNILRRPSAWSRLVKLFRRGGLRALAERARQEVHLAAAAPARRDPEESRLLQQAIETASPLVPLRLSTSDEPKVSILIPVYGQHRTTYSCLASIAANPPSLAYEIIIADDASPEPAADALAMVDGVRIVRHPQNLGFLGNVNAGIGAARGEWLILLNNDTLVCRGALDALVETFSQHDEVGLVGAKLLNRDGSVQEAGGIIWRDASGWNWGRNQHREDPRFNYVRDVDYCSGAALAMPRELFVSMGGFDTYYAPAYYEDTDLAFRVRERGLRVLYQPAAEIYHLEGVSHGTDTSSGVKAYQEVNAKKFAERWKPVLTNHRENADEPELEAHRDTRGNILVVEACMITPDQDSGSIRMFNLLKLLKREGFHVTFVADNLEYQHRYVSQLQQLGIEVYFNEWTGGSVEKLLRRLGPELDYIIFCRHYIASQYVPEVRSLAPRARIIFDTVDLHFVREQREAELHNSSAMLKASKATREQELGLIRACDVTLVVSDFEKNLLAELVPEARVEIVSNIHSHIPDRPGYALREGILFVGGFRHPPNVDAINWYAKEVLPHLRHLLPNVVTKVIGSNMPDSLKALASEDLELLGFIENIEPYLQKARVSIAPLRYGAGVKGKVNEAMNYAIPVVATACAVEGMHLRAEEEVLVAEDARAFAEAIARVYLDEALWNKLSAAGVANVERHFSPDAALPAIRRFLA